MKFSSALVVAVLASCAHAQSVLDQVMALEAQYPACAVPCLTTATLKSQCGPTDIACICGAKRPDITAQSSPCLLEKCTTNEVLKTQEVSDQICNLAAKVAAAGASTSSNTSSSSPSDSSTTPDPIAQLAGQSRLQAAGFVVTVVAGLAAFAC